MTGSVVIIVIVIVKQTSRKKWLTLGGYLYSEIPPARQRLVVHGGRRRRIVGLSSLPTFPLFFSSPPLENYMPRYHRYPMGKTDGSVLTEALAGSARSAPGPSPTPAPGGGATSSGCRRPSTAPRRSGSSSSTGRRPGGAPSPGLRRCRSGVTCGPATRSGPSCSSAPRR